MPIPKSLEHGRAKVSLWNIQTDEMTPIGTFGDFSYLELSVRTPVATLGRLSPAEIIEERTGEVVFTASRWSAFEQGPVRRIVDLVSAGPLQFEVAERTGGSIAVVATIRARGVAAQKNGIRGDGYLLSDR